MNTFVGKQGLELGLNERVKSRPFKQEDREFNFSNQKKNISYFSDKMKKFFPKDIWFKGSEKKKMMVFLDNKESYNPEELSFFREFIFFQKENAEDDLRLIKENSKSNGTDDTYKAFKSFEEASETTTKDASITDLVQKENHIKDLKRAEIRSYDSSVFGICKTSKKLIHPWRIFSSVVATERVSIKKMRKGN